MLNYFEYGTLKRDIDVILKERYGIFLLVPAMKKPLLRKWLFLRNKSWRICEIHFACEISLRCVKHLWCA